MLRGRDIVCFAHDWESDPTSKTHIMRILSATNRVLWINSIGMRRPVASRRDLRRMLTKLTQALRGNIRVHGNLHVLNPLVLPFHGVPGVARFNDWILAAVVRRSARRLGFRRPILWTFMPNVGGLVGRLEEGAVIYHCVDEYSEFSGVAAESLRAMERDLARKADLVFTSAEQLCRERRVHNSRTFFVSHGVDARHFSKALDPGTLVPTEIQVLRRPVIGFFGLIADWLDLALVQEVALKRPDWSVVLIGRVTTDVGALMTLPNVHLLGPRPYASLPGYCKGFDVGIIPFKVNALTLRANPLKLREYLAAGLPVVAADLPEVRKYHGMVRIASDPGSLVDEVQAALGESSEARARERAEAMRAESWEARVEELSRVIESFEEEQASSGSLTSR